MASIVLGVAYGPIGWLSLGGVLREFLGLESGLANPDILWSIRLPRVVLGALVGGTLAIAGCGYQGVFRNPLADPYLLGSAAGAGLGATIAVVYWGSAAGVGPIGVVPIAAFTGAMVAVWGAWAVSRAAGNGPAALLLSGVAVAAFLTAAQTYLQQRHVATLQEVYGFILGSLGGSWSDVWLLLPYAVVCVAVLLIHARLLDVMAVGDAEAASLGVDVRRVRLLVVSAATLGTAAAVAVSGLIGFVGLVVPHTLRLLVRTGSMRVLLPLSFIVGGAFMVGCDVIARTIEAPGELPIGVVTAFIGAPFFALVLRSSRRVLS